MPAPPAAQAPDRSLAWLAGRFAHRGLHGPGSRPGGPDAVENSTPAFAGAIAAGLGIECDVQLTADGRAAVFHDFTLERLTDAAGPVVARSAADLARLDVGGAPVPMLPDLLAQVGGAVPLLIEVKTRPRWEWRALTGAVASALAGYEGAVAVMSFDPRVPRWLAVHAPAIPRGLVLSEFDATGPFARTRLRASIARSRAQFLAGDVRDLPGGLAVELRATGLRLAVWTVRTLGQAALARAHADAIIGEGTGLQGPCATQGARA